MKPVYYVNLTNGLEGFARRWVQPQHVRYMRVQSTYLEQKRFYQVIEGLSDDLLFNLATGRKCVIIDFGARKEVPRAIWQGMEFVMYCLHVLWLDETYKFAYERSQRCKPYFWQLLQAMPDSCRKKLQYYKRYCAGKIHVEYRVAPTAHDGDKEFYWSIVQEVMQEKEVGNAEANCGIAGID